MKIYPSLLSLIPFVFIFNGLITRNHETTINIRCNACAGKEMTAFSMSVLRNKQEILFHPKFDSNGFVSIKLNNQDSITIHLHFLEPESSPILPRVYLEPGTRLDVNIEEDISVFKGNLDQFNGFLQKSDAISRKHGTFREVHYDEIHRSTDQEKEAYLLRIRSSYKELDSLIEQDQSLSRYYKDLLININAEYEIDHRLEFDLHKMRLTDMQKNDLSTGKNATGAVPVNFFLGISVNPYLLKFKSSFYVLNLKEHVAYKLRELFEFYWENVDEEKVGKYEFIRSAIDKNPQLAAYPDFFLALSLATDAFLIGIAYDDLLNTVKAFEKDYPHSAYLAELKHILIEQGELKGGMPLKDFTMLDTNGREFKLSDLKGKLVYIDVWATWCGPCVSEFKYSKKLVKRYINKKELVFLYLSKDNKQDVWKKYLRHNPSLQGLHAIQPPRNIRIDTNNVMHLYKINGIPRYILIGKDGKIIDYNAARPSELVTGNYLDSLLSI